MCYCVSLIVTGVSERLRRNVYNGFEENSGDFTVIYEWSLQWNKKMGTFLTSQEKGRIDNCKKQASKIKADVIIKSLVLEFWTPCGLCYVFMLTLKMSASCGYCIHVSVVLI